MRSGLSMAGLSMAVAAAAVFATPAMAATADIDAMVKCAADPVNATRLACYDKAISGISAAAREASVAREAATAELAKQQAVADAKAAEAARIAAVEAQRNAFGGGGLKNVPKPLETMASITEHVTAASVNKQGLWIVVLDNGQVWRQTDGDPLPSIMSGDTVNVRKGPLGSYRLSSPRWPNRDLKVIRLR